MRRVFDEVSWTVRGARRGWSALGMTLLLAGLAGTGCRSGCGCGEAPDGAGVATAPLGPTTPSATTDSSGFLEEFTRPGPLDPQRWLPTRKNDFEEASVEVVADSGEQGDGRLRLRAATVGTDDRTVKALGVVHPVLIDLTQPATITVEMDWANQANGSYLTQSVILSPTLVERDATETPDWLSFSWVGVPPGQQARPEVMRKTHGNLQVVDRFGWPETIPGRTLTRNRVTLEIQGRSLRVLIDGKEVSRRNDAGFRFERAYLYLQLGTHSNYTAREVFFDRVEIRGRLVK